MSAVLLFPLTSSTIAVGDPAATRTVYLTTIALVLLGLGLGVLSWWLFRRTRPEPELFAPLEQMETRSWRKLDPADRTESLDAVRPWGARPVSREASVDDKIADDEIVDDEGTNADEDGADDEDTSMSADDIVARPDDASSADVAADGLGDATSDDQPDGDGDDGDGPVNGAAKDATPTALPLERDENDRVGEATIGDDDLDAETDESDSHEDDATVSIDRAPSN